jgi:prolyl-tRNA editing enzyme YbaK/EbsC (Cys-tRNA(Pro) deacylase)
MNAAAATPVQSALEATGVSFEVLSCDPTLADTAVFCEHYAIPAKNSANTIVVGSKKGDRQFVACVLLSNCRLDVNKTVRKKMGVRRLSFASPEETRELTGMELGGVTPLALPPELSLWVDQRVMQASYIILGGGNRSSKIKVSPDVFLHTPNTSIVDGLALEITVD